MSTTQGYRCPPPKWPVLMVAVAATGTRILLWTVHSLWHEWDRILAYLHATEQRPNFIGKSIESTVIAQYRPSPMRALVWHSSCGGRAEQKEELRRAKYKTLGRQQKMWAISEHLIALSFFPPTFARSLYYVCLRCIWYASEHLHVERKAPNLLNLHPLMLPTTILLVCS